MAGRPIPSAMALRSALPALLLLAFAVPAPAQGTEDCVTRITSVQASICCPYTGLATDPECSDASHWFLGSPPSRVHILAVDDVNGQVPVEWAVRGSGGSAIHAGTHCMGEVLVDVLQPSFSVEARTTLMHGCPPPVQGTILIRVWL
jgi:hypothetical protein